MTMHLFRAHVVLLIAAFLLSWDSHAQQPAVPRLRAGAAAVDITPAIPVALAGYLNPENRVSQGVHDRLYARVIAFADGSRRVVLVSCDLTSFISAAYFQSRILSKFHLQPEELFLCATHTHSGPELSLNRTYPHPNNFQYTVSLSDRLLSCINAAFGDLGPCSVAAGKADCRVGVNRRKPVAGGPVEMAPNPAGPADPELLVLSLSRERELPFAALFSYACHSRSLRGTNTLVSGDIFGIAEQFVERARGNRFIAAAFAGASGDIDPVSVVAGFDPPAGSVSEPIRLGTVLGEAVVGGMKAAHPLQAVMPIRTLQTHVPLPRKVQGQTAPVTVSLARIGDLAIVGLDCEASVEIGRAIRSASPFAYTFIVTVCNGWSGYLPVAHQYSEGGYEVSHSGFGPDAAGILVRETLRLLSGLR